jgi:hypothetical protein
MRSTGRHARPTRRRVSVAGVIIAGATATVMAVTGAGAASAASAVTLTNATWQIEVVGTGTVSIDSTYGAPGGFGGSALVERTPASGDKARFWTGKDAGAPLATALADVSYWTYRSGDSTAASHLLPAIKVEADMNGSADGGYTTLVFEPVYQSGGAAAVQSDIWQSWDADGAAIWWSSRAIPGVCAFDCFVPLSEILTDNPDAVLLTYGIGQGSGNAGLTGAADGLTINGQTFDFQASMPFDDCKDGGWTQFTDPEFVNQGDCVSFFASGSKTHG